jgi:hypothetical protein
VQCGNCGYFPKTEEHDCEKRKEELEKRFASEPAHMTFSYQQGMHSMRVMPMHPPHMLKPGMMHQSYHPMPPGMRMQQLMPALLAPPQETVTSTPAVTETQPPAATESQPPPAATESQAPTALVEAPAAPVESTPVPVITQSDAPSVTNETSVPITITETVALESVVSSQESEQAETPNRKRKATEVEAEVESTPAPASTSKPRLPRA